MSELTSTSTTPLPPDLPARSPSASPTTLPDNLTNRTPLHSLIAATKARSLSAVRNPVSHGHGGLKRNLSLTNLSQEPVPAWTIEDSENIYNLEGWGAPYFKINSTGNVECDPTGLGSTQQFSIDLYELTKNLIERGHNLPLLIRFTDILSDRIRILNMAFIKAISEYSYDNVYRGVYPVKVCQQKHVIEEIVAVGRNFQYGLEAGSKPELLIALSCMTTEDALVTCNGYKDSEYIETALLAQQLGTRTIIIIEKLHEIDLVLQAAKKLDIKPIVGVRARLSVRGSGHWGESTGDKAKFGLSASDIVQVIEKLREVDLLDSLQLLHFHIGSQISSISVIKYALKEACQYFVQLHRLGANMQYIDVGGGLGVDYDGSKTSFCASINYTVDEYAADIVIALKNMCDRFKIPAPCIISESGRAVSSHQTVLVFNVLHATQPLAANANIPKPEIAEHNIIQQLYTILNTIKPKGLQEAYHDAHQLKEESQTLFTMGLISLKEKAKIEEMYWSCCRKCSQMSGQIHFIPEELVNLERDMAFMYYCNFSVFQSAPDLWAIDQLFPICPIHRLDEKPTALGTLADLTCDSDGKIDRFITSGTEDVKNLLELHELEDDKPYYLGMFLVGAYQEILGNLHNLYGDTNAVNIEIDPEDAKGYKVKHVIKGDTTEEVLRYMQYEPSSMMDSIRTQSEIALKKKKLNLMQYRLLMKHFEKALRAYTYLWADE